MNLLMTIEKQKITTLLISLSIALTACNTDVTLETLSSEFQGKWKETGCSTKESGSYVENWELKKNVLIDTINIWDQTGCPKDIASEKLIIKAYIYAYDFSKTGEVDVSAICSKGKAIGTMTTLSAINRKKNNKTITKHQEIKDILISNKLNRVLPLYDLICLDNEGYLHTGDLSTGNGTESNKRPKEMNPQKKFKKQ